MKRLFSKCLLIATLGLGAAPAASQALSASPCASPQRPISETYYSYGALVRYGVTEACYSSTIDIGVWAWIDGSGGVANLGHGGVVSASGLQLYQTPGFHTFYTKIVLRQLNGSVWQGCDGGWTGCGTNTVVLRQSSTFGIL